jgi:hypothetical protein
MAQVLLDIAQNASIRGMRVDGEDRFSVYDLMNYVCGKDSKSTYAHRTFARISESSDIQTDVCTNYTNIKFTGKGQKPTPCMTILGLQKLLLILGTKASAEFRDRVLECFNRVLAGDRTLIREIGPSLPYFITATTSFAIWL